jgi:hypothetical protein
MRQNHSAINADAPVSMNLINAARDFPGQISVSLIPQKRSGFRVVIQEKA